MKVSLGAPGADGKCVSSLMQHYSIGKEPPMESPPATTLIYCGTPTAPRMCALILNGSISSESHVEQCAVYCRCMYTHKSQTVDTLAKYTHTRKPRKTREITEELSHLRTWRNAFKSYQSLIAVYPRVSPGSGITKMRLSQK